MIKLKACADDKLNIAKMMMCLVDREDNTVGKGENAGHQHFLLFPQCFPLLWEEETKTWLMWYDAYLHTFGAQFRSTIGNNMTMPLGIF